ncbi:MAG: hypothetical protein ACRDZW_06860 [Acidimicrobiales bacterium]
MAGAFLDEMIAERTLANPVSPALLGAAVQRRQAETELADDDAPEAK